MPITVTVRRPVKCSAGFDYEATTGECVRNTPGGSPGAGTPGNSGSSGGGNTNTNTNTGRRTVDFTLTCPTATRGASGTCSVSAPGEELGTLEFAWSSAAGGSVAKTPGKSSWSGTAVSEVTVTVTISDPAGAIAEATETDTADVAARDWTFTPPTPDSTSSGYGGANWHPGKWGQHDSGSTTTPGVLAGSGPWENLYTGDVAPVHNNDNGITLHNDFDANDAGHPGANRVSCFAAKDTSTVANVVAVNDACGTSSQLSSWEGMVLAHEADHAASGDRCLKSKKTADTIRDLEAITGDDVEEVRNELYETWNGFWEQTVLPAFEGRLSTPTSPRIWEYRFKGRWDRHKVTGGREGGTTSCR